MELAHHSLETRPSESNLGPISLDRHLIIVVVHLYSITNCYDIGIPLGSLEHLRGLTHIPKLLQEMDTFPKYQILPASTLDSMLDEGSTLYSK